MKTSLRKDIIRKYGKRKPKRGLKKNRYEDMIINGVALIVLILFIIYVKNTFFPFNKVKSLNTQLSNVTALGIPTNTFKSLESLAEKYNFKFYELLAVYCLYNDFFPDKTIIQSKEEIEQKFIINYEKIKSSYKEKEIKPYIEMFETLFSEIKYFPIMTGFEGSDGSYMYGDSWGSQRTYEADRLHEGCDILDRENIRGRIPLASMTDGIIEQIGWNELGGFSVGVRSDSGTYYYYAHMDRFAESLVKGSKITAGQLIGFMGDTGYSKKEGATGNFPVHLHVGISPDTSITNKEFWINPYPFLRYIEDVKAEY